LFPILTVPLISTLNKLFGPFVIANEVLLPLLKSNVTFPLASKAKLFPLAVINLDIGYKAVDYGLLP
jgi:hypothetical protein